MLQCKNLISLASSQDSFTNMATIFYLFIYLFEIKRAAMFSVTCLPIRMSTNELSLLHTASGYTPKARTIQNRWCQDTVVRLVS